MDDQRPDWGDLKSRYPRLVEDARGWVRNGAPVSEVELRLRQVGMTSAEASTTVDELLSEKLATENAAADRNWYRKLFLNVLYFLGGVAAVVLAIAFYQVELWGNLYVLRGILIAGAGVIAHSLFRFYFLYQGWNPDVVRHPNDPET